MKIQKTDVGSGYHVWHWEQEGRQNSSRLLNVPTVPQHCGTGWWHRVCTITELSSAGNFVDLSHISFSNYNPNEAVPCTSSILD